MNVPSPQISIVKQLRQRGRPVQQDSQLVEHVAPQDSLLTKLVAYDTRQHHFTDLQIDQVQKDSSPFAPLTAQPGLKRTPRTNPAQIAGRDDGPVGASIDNRSQFHTPAGRHSSQQYVAHRQRWIIRCVVREIAHQASSTPSIRPPIQRRSRCGPGPTGAMRTGNKPNRSRTRFSKCETSPS